MDNIELEQKVLEIIETENFFDMILKAKEFEKEYKNSDFYKATKMPLNEVIKESKIYYSLQLRDLGSKLQNILDNLSLESLNDLLDRIGGVFSQENEEIQSGLEVIRSLKD